MAAGLALRPGLSFCEAGGRLIFLDLVGDRYFCLPGPAEQAFRRIVANAPMNDRTAGPLADLISSGLLVPSPDSQPIRQCVPPTPPDESLLEVAGTARAGAIAHAVRRIALAKAALGLIGLHQAVSAVRRRKSRLRPGPASPRWPIEEIAKA